MSEYAKKTNTIQSWVREKLFMGLTWDEYLSSLITPFNIVAGFIVLVGLNLIVLRFSQGLAAVTSASDDQPWGLFLSWGLFAGVPLSATGFVLGTAVYLFGLKEYHPVVKNAILIGFLGYFFAVVFLLVDLGRPWRIFYPMLISFGPASVMFLVAWHVALYLSCQFLEFSPAIFEWAGFKTLRSWALQITIGLTVFGIILSTLHQSALGAMFLLMPGKLHPLWYTPYIPWLFLISAIAAGLSMVIVVSALTQRFFKDHADHEYLVSLDSITLGLGKAASFALFTYFGLKLVALAHGHHWSLLNTSWGRWFLVELVAFVLLPCFLFYAAIRGKNVGLVQFTALLTIIGVIINRLNVSLIAFNWHLPHRELVNGNEAIIVIAIVTIEVLTYRWIVSRMPVLREHPAYAVAYVRRPALEFVPVAREAGILPGATEPRYSRWPLLGAMVTGPLMGLLYVITLPVSAVVFVFRLGARRVQGAWARARWARAPRRPGEMGGLWATMEGKAGRPEQGEEN